MLRIVVCSLLLAGFIAGMNKALHIAQASLDFWTYIALCAFIALAFIALAFGSDHYERKSSPKSQRSAMPDPRQLEP